MNTKARIHGASHWLVSSGLLDAELIGQARTGARDCNRPLVSYLAENRLLESPAMAMAASRQFGLPFLDLDAIEASSLGAGLVDPQLMRQHHVLPLARNASGLALAVSDPANDSGLHEIAFRAGCKINLVVVEADKLESAIREISRVGGDLPEVMTALDETAMAGILAEDSLREQDDGTPDNTEQAPVTRFVNKVLMDAIRQGVSDIHIEPFEQACRIRYRQDGRLREICRTPRQAGRKITARLKVMSQLDIAEKRLPQDGRFRLNPGGTRAVDVRISTLPALWGEKTVLRILDSDPGRLDLDSLGFSAEQKHLYLAALEAQQGLILITGPTGSGKSMTLYAGLCMLNSQDRNIQTAEDPVEMHLDGISQVAVNPALGLTFAETLRAFLRQDPDVMMVGEIRDAETAGLALRAAQTGHLVMSTLHTNSAVETLTRLQDMGIRSFQVATSLILVIAQRLLRRLCSHCKKPLHLPDNLLIQEGFSSEQLGKITLYAPVGCDKCHAGYRGRVGIYEILPITGALSRVIMDGGNSIQIADMAVKEGFNSLRISALEKAASGQTSLTEVNRMT